MEGGGGGPGAKLRLKGKDASLRCSAVAAPLAGFRR